MSTQVNKRQRTTYDTVSTNDAEDSSVTAELIAGSSSVSAIARYISCGQEGHLRSTNRLCPNYVAKTDCSNCGMSDHTRPSSRKCPTNPGYMVKVALRFSRSLNVKRHNVGKMEVVCGFGNAVM